MPRYDFTCTKCEKTFEETISDFSVKITCKCGGEAKREFPLVGNVIFRGSGFYSTDYKKSTPVIKGKVEDDG